MADLENSEVRLVLQQQIFSPDQERLTLAIAVTPFDDKKRIRYLCLALGKDNAFIYIVKQDKKAFRKKPDSWPVSMLKEVSGRSPRGEPCLDFELSFGDQKKGNTYVWTTTSISDKNAFFVQLSRLARRFGDQQFPLRFVHLEEDLEDQLARIGLEATDAKGDKLGVSALGSQRTFVQDKEEVLSLTEKEQGDLQQVFELSRQFDYDGDVLVRSLNAEISQMESANVHDLMNTHTDIENICRLIDQSLEDLNKMDKKIVKYHGLVGDVSDQVTMMDETGHKLKVQNRNIKKLIQDISAVLDTLEFNNSYRLALMDGDMMNPDKLPEIVDAATVLSKIVTAPLPLGFEYHPAVIRQKKTLEKVKSAFGNRVVQNLTNSFVAYSNNRTPRSDLLLPTHSPWFRTLAMFSPIVKWMQDGLPQIFDMLLRNYLDKLSELYRWEYTEFFEKVKARVSVSADSNNGTRVNPEYWLGWEDEITISPADYAEYKAHLDHIRVAFSQIAACVVDEQNFLVRFFGLSVEGDHLGVNSSVAISDMDRGMVESASQNSLMPRLNPQLQSSVVKTETPLRVRLKELFKNIDEMLQAVVGTADKVNKLNNMGLLVFIHEILIEVEPKCPFLSKCFGGIMITVKRNFDNYIKEQVISILNSKIPKKSRVGPLFFVCNFEHFAKFAETVFSGSQRRIDLDRAYYNLLKQGIFEGVNRVANHKDCKAPPEVVFFENYHRLFDILSRLKIPFLEDTRRDVRQRYNDYRKTYVQGMLGKPLDKVQIFFDGVDAKIQTAGIQPHEVAFTTQFSRTELRKVLAMYPRNVVKKGLEQLYKKVEKQLSDEENLLEVVWRDMQQEFIEQYQNYLRIIEVCYPNSQIVFGFGIDDILKIFEEIAASH